MHETIRKEGKGENCEYIDTVGGAESGSGRGSVCPRTVWVEYLNSAEYELI